SADSASHAARVEGHPDFASPSGSHGNGTGVAPCLVPVSSDAAVPDADAAFDVLRAVASEVRKSQPALASVLEHAAIISQTTDALVLGFERGSFLAEQIATPAGRGSVEAAVRGVLGQDARLGVELVERRAADTLAKRAADELRDRVARAERDVR